MWRYQARCNHCGKSTSWFRDREASVMAVAAHLQEAHQVTPPRESEEYQITRERQCDYCLEPFLDSCTKCAQDFCTLHAGDIDGLCGGCI